MAIIEWRRQRRRPLDGGGTRRRLFFRPLYSRNFKRTILFAVAFLAIFPPLYFHFKLRRIRQIVAQKCDWLHHPPLVCAHGGDSTLAFPNTVNSLDLFYCILHTLKPYSLLFSIVDGCLQFRYTLSSWLHRSRCFSFLRWCFIRSPQQVTDSDPCCILFFLFLCLDSHRSCYFIFWSNAQSGICSVLLVTRLFKLEIWVWNRSPLFLSINLPAFGMCFDEPFCRSRNLMSHKLLKGP